MENFMISVNAVLPLMLCIGAGYLTRRLNWADDAFFVKCNSFCFKAFLSLMLFTNVYDADLKTAFQPKLVLFTVFSVLAVAAALPFWQSIAGEGFQQQSRPDTGNFSQ